MNRRELLGVCRYKLIDQNLKFLSPSSTLTTKP